MFVYYSIILFISITTLFILSLLVHENGRLIIEQKKSFYFSYAVIIVAAFMEWIGIVMNGAPLWTKYIHGLIKVFDYTLTPAIAYFFIIQIDNCLKVKKYLIILEVIDIIFILISVPFGWVFYIDNNNVYHHGPYYIIYSIIYIIMILFLVAGFLEYGKRFPSSNKKSLIAIVMLAIASVTFQEILGKFIRTGYLGLTIASTLLFIHFEEFYQQEMDEDGKVKTILLKKDALTGLYSRYAYNEQLKNHRNPPLSTNLCVLLIDINGLKEVNDTLGHEKGDELICKTAAAIEIAAADKGQVYRTGGDEFVIILDILSYSIKEFENVLNSEFSKNNNQSMKSFEINVAIGSAYAKDYPDFTLEQLVEVADKDMYNDKEKYYQRKYHNRRKQ